MSRSAEERKANFPMRWYQPGDFEAADHFYPRCLNATLHETVKFFKVMGNKRIVSRYCHTHPDCDPRELRALLTQYKPRHLLWSGCDLMYCNIKETSQSEMIVIETNSCASVRIVSTRLWG